MLKVLSDSELRRVYEELLVRKDGFASVSQKGSASVPHCCASDDGFKLICAFDDECAVVEDIPSFPSSDFLAFLAHFESVLVDAGIVRCDCCGCYYWEDDGSAPRTCMVCGAQYDSQGACPECNNLSVLHRLGGPLDIKILCQVTELNGYPCLEYHPSVLGSVFRFSVGYALDGRVVPVSFETTDELFEFTRKELSDGQFVHYLLVASGLFDCHCAYDLYEYNKFHSKEVDCNA